jgi:hypothetical protein
METKIVLIVLNLSDDLINLISLNWSDRGNVWPEVTSVMAPTNGG